MHDRGVWVEGVGRMEPGCRFDTDDETGLLMTTVTRMPAGADGFGRERHNYGMYTAGRFCAVRSIDGTIGEYHTDQVRVVEPRFDLVMTGMPGEASAGPWTVEVGGTDVAEAWLRGQVRTRAEREALLGGMPLDGTMDLTAYTEPWNGLRIVRVS